MWQRRTIHKYPSFYFIAGVFYGGCLRVSAASKHYFTIDWYFTIAALACYSRNATSTRITYLGLESMEAVWNYIPSSTIDVHVCLFSSHLFVEIERWNWKPIHVQLHTSCLRIYTIIIISSARVCYLLAGSTGRRQWMTNLVGWWKKCSFDASL